jgi:hypothetical protein
MGRHDRAHCWWSHEGRQGRTIDAPLKRR